MKKLDLTNFLALISVGFFSELKGVKLNYAIAKNKASFQIEDEAITKARELTKKYKLIDEERIKLCDKLCKKDEDGEHILINGQYTFTRSSMDKITAWVKESKDKNPAIYKEQEKQNKIVEKLLQEEYEGTIHKVKVKDLPNDINQGQMDALYFMIQD